MVQITARDDNEKVLARRRMILGEASKCFREKGFHSTGMRDVASRLGMTVGSLYYYFENKEELLRFCQEEALSRLESLVDRVERSPIEPDEALFHLVSGHVVSLNEGHWGSLAHLEIPRDASPLTERLLHRRRNYERALEGLIERGMSEGIFRPGEPRLAVMAILGAVNWTVRWFNPNGSRTAQSVGASFAEQLVRGLLVESRSERPRDWEPLLPPSSGDHTSDA